MSFDAHANFGVTTVVTPPTPSTSGSTIIVNDGTVFPAVPFNATVWPPNLEPTVSNAEIVRVTNRVGNTLTATRAQESSVAVAIQAGYQIANTVTVKTLTDVEALKPTASVITTTGTSTALALPSGSGPLFIYANNATALTIQGITAGIDGQPLTIVSMGAGGITVQDQNAGASAANRIACPGSTDLIIAAAAGSCSLAYDGTASRWRVIAPAGVAGGLDYVQMQVFG